MSKRRRDGRRSRAKVYDETGMHMERRRAGRSNENRRRFGVKCPAHRGIGHVGTRGGPKSEKQEDIRAEGSAEPLQRLVPNPHLRRRTVFPTMHLTGFAKLQGKATT